MYRNLEAEMARAGITQGQLAKELGITPTTLSLKLNGKSNLSLRECVKIKRFRLLKLCGGCHILWFVASTLNCL